MLQPKTGNPTLAVDRDGRVASLRRRQRERLTATLSAARELPGYREALAGFSPEGDPFEALSSLPLLSREQIQRRPGDFRDLRRRSLILSSSGSTGTPLRIHIAPHSRRRRRRQFAGYFLRHGWMPWNPAISLKIPSDPSARFGSGAIDRGPLRLRRSVSVLDPVDEQYRAIRESEPEILHGLPSILVELAELAELEGWRPSRLRRIFAVSETLSPRARREIERGFGAPVYDLYAAAEAFVGFECERRCGFHVHETNVVLEVLDERGEPAAPGAIGNVVITTLDNPAMPLVRYAIGDVAVAGGDVPCPCGRPHTLLPAVIGRHVPLFDIGGRRVSPWGVIARMAELHFVRQFQIVQPAPDSVEVRLRLRAGATVDEPVVRRLVAEELSEAVAVAIAPVSEIPQLPSGKAASVVAAPSFPAVPEPAAPSEVR